MLPCDPCLLTHFMYDFHYGCHDLAILALQSTFSPRLSNNITASYCKVSIASGNLVHLGQCLSCDAGSEQLKAAAAAM